MQWHVTGPHYISQVWCSGRIASPLCAWPACLTGVSRCTCASINVCLQVYHFLDVLWLLLKTYLTSKVYAAVDSLLVMTAEVLNHAPLRMVTDQVSTDPVAIVATALPNVVNERLSESPHFFRPAHALWKVMRMLLFNASTEPPGRYERIVLRNAFVPDRAVEPEDTFLAARYGEERGKPVSDLAVMMRKSDMLLRAADIIVNSSNKNYVCSQSWTCM